MYRINLPISKVVLLLLLFLSCTVVAVSQQREPRSLQGRLSAITKEGSSSRWLELRKDQFIPVNEMLEEIRFSTGLTRDDVLSLKESRNDRFGFTKHIYQQYYNGIEVVGALYSIRERSGRVEMANGFIVSGLNESIRSANPFITLQQATSVLFEHATRKGIKPGKMYRSGMWDTVIVNRLSVFSYNPEDWKLAYHYRLTSLEQMVDEDIYIDALDGSIIKVMPLIATCTTASGNTRYHGNQSFGTEYRSGTSDYRLYNACVTSANGTVWTRNWNCPNAPSEITNGTTTWTSTADEVGIGAQWAGEQAYEYFFSEHGRRSYNGASSGGGATVKIYTGYMQPNGSTPCFVVQNAYWGNGEIKLGSGNGLNGNTTDWASIDLVAHEFTHGVTQYSSGLAYAGESGALNESFSDIFGELVEYYALGLNDWLIAPDISTSQDPLRSMSDPHAEGDPDTYGTQDGNWVDPNCANPDDGNDWCGVHTNSGVSNFWFYLLAIGGSGTNANNDSYAVTGIGRDKAADIAYLTLTELSYSSEFIDARYESIHAAKELFGECSEEQLQCARAWSAVGVGNAVIENNLTQVCTTLSSTHNYESAYIEAAGCSTSPTDCTLESTADVEFKANRRIILHPGFQAKAGAELHAYLDELCTEILDKHIAFPPSGSDTREIPDPMAGTTQLSCLPNPSSTTFTVRYKVLQPATVTILIKDQLGKEIQTIVDQTAQAAGTFEKPVSTGSIPSGVYYVTLFVDGKLTGTEKLVVAH